MDDRSLSIQLEIELIKKQTNKRLIYQMKEQMNVHTNALVVSGDATLKQLFWSVGVFVCWSVYKLARTASDTIFRAWQSLLMRATVSFGY